MPTTVADRIEKQIVLQAPRSRVWSALSDAEEFGRWFGVKLHGAFTEGATVRGQITHPGYEHLTMELLVERIEPERYFAYRWHPYAVDPAVDYEKEEPTLVTFTLKDAPGNATLLTVVETGFDKVPPERRLEAFRMNGNGWQKQLENIARHVGT